MDDKIGGQKGGKCAIGGRGEWWGEWWGSGGGSGGGSGSGSVVAGGMMGGVVGVIKGVVEGVEGLISEVALRLVERIREYFLRLFSTIDWQ